MQSLISVALCTYNSSRFIHALLDSLLQQTWSNIEIVCCDDKSTDDTQIILRQYAVHHAGKFRLYFNRENIGYVKNFEQALSLCNGNYIAIADHDDIWLPFKIEKLFHAIGDALMVYSDSIYMDETGRLLNEKISSHINLYDKPDARSFSFSNPVWGHTALIKKELLQYALPIPSSVPYDVWLAYTAANVSFVNYLDEALTYFRKHTTSYSSILDKQRNDDSGRKMNAWKEKMLWLEILKTAPFSKHTTFYKQLQQLYAKKETQAFVWPLFFFLYRHRKMLFKSWKRSYISSLNEIRKIARGVK